jgi:TonB family protein
MADSITAESTSSTTPVAGYYQWQVPGKSISIYLNLDVVDRLEREVVDTFRAVTKRGSEIGGVLLGRWIPESSTVVIEDYEPVPCSYSRGPLYLLSEEDRRQIGTVLSKFKSGSGKAVVGYFRSNTRKDISLDEEDLSVVNEHFPEPSAVFLLVKPFAMKPSMAGFFFREDGEVRAEASYLPFPFKKPELLKGDFQKAVVPGVPAGVPGAAPAPVRNGKASTPTTVTISVVAGPGVKGASAQGLAAAQPATTSVPSREQRPNPPAEPARGKATRKTGSFLNLDAPVVSEPAPADSPAPPSNSLPAPVVVETLAEEKSQPAKEKAAGFRSPWPWVALIALLIISAGLFVFLRQGRETAPAQDPSALSLKVEPSNGQLALSWNRSAPLIQTAQRAILTISDGDHKEDVELDLGQLRSGSIVYSPITRDVSFRLEVTDLRNAKSTSESVRVLAGRPSPSAVTPVQTPTGRPQAEPVAGATEPAQTPVQPEAAPRVARSFTPPSAKRASSDSLAARLSPGVPEPPQIDAGASAAPSLPASISAPAPPPEAPKPAAQSASAQPAGAVKLGGKVQPATLIYRTAPIYPMIAKQARVAGSVRLSAVIGKDGRIEKVEVLSGPPLLRQAAIDAVKQWRYSPNLLNGEPVPSTTTIDLNFAAGR